MTFNEALPEDIFNENFPDTIESFDFPDASLLDLVKAIGKLTGINFIVDTGLKGKKISIIAPSPITVAEAYKAFLSALAANKYTIVKAGAFWKIVRTEEAHKDNIEVYSGDYFPNTDQLITRIIRLKYLNAKSFSGSIKLFLSQQNKLSIHESSNSLIISDYGSVIERIMKIVYEMDVRGSEEDIYIIQIEHASASEVSSVLIQLLSSSLGSRTSFSGDKRRTPRITLSPSVKTEGLGGIRVSKIIPDERTNSIVVSANKEGFKRVNDLVKKLDTRVDASRAGGVYVYNVLYGTAEEMYSTLMGIKPSGGSRDTSVGRREGPISSGRFRFRGGIGSSAESPLFQNVTIMADTNTNSLIISAKNKYDYENVKAVLEKIDVPRDQVFIQAIIVEMTVDNQNDKQINLGSVLGQNFINMLTDYFGETPVFQSILGSSFVGFFSQSFDLNSLQNASVGPGFILSSTISKMLNFLSGTDQRKTELLSAFNETSSFRNLTQDQQTRVLSNLAGGESNLPLDQVPFPLLRIFQTTSNVNVISTPQLTTLDNVKAFIEVGENAPVRLTSVASVGGGIAQNSVESEDITLKLEITPRINPESGTVQMDIKQKFDDFSNRSSGASELAGRGVHIIKRNIETKMVLNDGETAVLGGLFTDKEVKTENKIPILGDIPLLGWLFKGSTVEKDKRNLMVFITPKIIKGEEQKTQAKTTLDKALEDRIHFIKKHMKGKNPLKETFERLVPESREVEKRHKKRWFWQKDPSKAPDQKPKDRSEEDLIESTDFPSSESVDMRPYEEKKNQRLFPSEEYDFFPEEKEEDLTVEDFQPAVPSDSVIENEDMKQERETLENLLEERAPIEQKEKELDDLGDQENKIEEEAIKKY